MKKFLYSSAVAVALLATACSNEAPVAESVADGTSTIQVTLPAAMKTRSLGNGLSAKTLYYAIYDAETGALINNDRTSFSDESNTTTVSLSLANGRAYKIAFFATTEGIDGESGYYWTPEAKTINIDYDKVKHVIYDTETWEAIDADWNYNNHDYDAFYGMYETEVVTGAFTGQVTLHRILAQVNWGTKDLEDPTVHDLYRVYEEDENLVTKVEYKNVYTTYDFWNEKVVGEATTVEFGYSPRPKVEFAEWRWDRDEYAYLSLAYLLVKEGPQVVDATLTSSDGNKEYSVVKVTNLPVQTNYQTVIRGALLSSKGEIEVTKVPDFDGTNGAYGDLNPGDNDINDFINNEGNEEEGE